MAIRTNSDLVKGVLLVDYDQSAKPSLVPFMTAASAIIDDLVARASSAGTTITAERAKLVETWLSAHQYCVSDRRRTKQRFFDGTQGEYESTSYLETAKQLDPSGLLDKILRRNKGVLLHLGKPPSEQIPYWQRD